MRSNGNPELVGRSILVPKTNQRISFSGFTIRSRFTKPVNPLFYAYLFKSKFHRELLQNVSIGANIKNISQEILRDVQIPFPPRKVQDRIVEQIEAEIHFVDASKRLLEIYDQKTKDRIAKVWGEK